MQIMNHPSGGNLPTQPKLPPALRENGSPPRSSITSAPMKTLWGVGGGSLGKHSWEVSETHIHWIFCRGDILETHIHWICLSGGHSWETRSDKTLYDLARQTIFLQYPMFDEDIPAAIAQHQAQLKTNYRPPI